MSAPTPRDPDTPRHVWIAVTAVVDAAHEEPAGEALRSAWRGGLLIAPASGGRVALTLYVPVEAYTPEKAAEIEARLAALDGPFPGFSFELSAESLEEENWAEAWKIHFKPHRIGERILIAPSWERPARRAGDIVVRLDPGAAFGTGLHETTKLCAAALERFVTPGARVLDIGCGTGILAIVAAKLGAAEVAATDIDPYAVAVTAENARKNRVGSRVRAARADLLEGAGDLLAGGPFDLVVANILLPEVLRLCPAVAPLLRRSGTLVLSGILADQLPQVEESLRRAGFEPGKPQQLGEWAVAVARRA